MRCVIILNALLLLYILSAVSAKSSNETSTSQNVSSVKAASMDKASSYPKKVTSLKKPKKSKTPTAAPTATTSATKKSATTTTTTTKAKGKRPVEPADVPVLTDTTFKNLPADDLEFIKELDKQFKLHGGKVKIKVERDNTTTSTGANTKNSKRTIEGDLGYGYAQNGGYDYNPPKFMFYPYSQQDIPQPTESSYYETANYESGKTSVTIEPSYSYELQPQTSYETTHDAQPQIDLPQPTVETSGIEQHEQPPVAEQPQQPTIVEQAHPHGSYEEPVIVLRIPGPTKYASHLQMLLQQYLEIRAAQYLRILEEAEERKQQQQHQHLIEAEPQQQYEEPGPAQPEEQHYTQDVTYAHQLAATPAPVSYPAIDDVYQSYKHQHLQQQQQQQQHQQQQSYQSQPPAEQYYAPQQQPAYQEVPQYYYMPQQQYAEPDLNPAYQPHLYLIAMSPQQPQAIYGDPHQQHQQQQQQQEHEHEHHHHHHQSQPIYVPDEAAHESAHELSSGASNLPITENNPRSTHTKVLFTQQQHGGDEDVASGGQAADYTQNSYSLPSIRPYERHQSASAAATYQTQHYQQTVAESNDAVEYQQQQQQQQQPHADTVAITQRPYNYHAHPHGSTKRAASASANANAEAKSSAASATTTTTNGEAEHRLQQIREYVREKLGAEMGSAVEYKTTQVLDG